MAPDWKKIRRDFPVTQRGIYLDHAACGPVPKPVARAVGDYYASNSREGDFAWPAWLARREAVRRKVAAFINAEPEEITFTQSTSHGMNLIAELIASEGTVLANRSEFPSSTLPWLWRGAKIIFQEPDRGRICLRKLSSLLAPGVKTVLSSYVQYCTGFRQDMEALGRLKGKRYLVVNATQGLGALPVDVKRWRADFLCANSYKWLGAGYGGGILYVRKGLLTKFRPASIGWRSVREPSRLDNQGLAIRPDAARYELGCPSFPTIFAVGAAVDYLKSIGVQAIEKRVLELSAFAAEELDRQGFEVTSPQEEASRSGIVVFKVKNALTKWQRLLKAGICVSPRGEGLRFSPHFYNTPREIQAAVEKIKRL